jgi:hypothetical protein
VDDRTFAEAVVERMMSRVQSPGVRCPARNDDWRCSRDEGHSGAHVMRSERGEGMIGWHNDDAPDERRG